jgi:hypothetical protein
MHFAHVCTLGREDNFFRGERKNLQNFILDIGVVLHA